MTYNIPSYVIIRRFTRPRKWYRSLDLRSAATGVCGCGGPVDHRQSLALSIGGSTYICGKCYSAFRDDVDCHNHLLRTLPYRTGSALIACFDKDCKWHNHNRTYGIDGFFEWTEEEGGYWKRPETITIHNNYFAGQERPA